MDLDPAPDLRLLGDLGPEDLLVFLGDGLGGAGGEGALDRGDRDGGHRFRDVGEEARLGGGLAAGRARRRRWRGSRAHRGPSVHPPRAGNEPEPFRSGSGVKPAASASASGGGGGGVAPVRVGRTAGLLPVAVPLARGRSGRSGGLSRTAGRIVGAGPPERAPCVCSSQTFTCSSPGDSATALRRSGSAERYSPLATRTSEMRW